MDDCGGDYPVGILCGWACAWRSEVEPELGVSSIFVALLCNMPARLVASFIFLFLSWMSSTISPGVSVLGHEIFNQQSVPQALEEQSALCYATVSVLDHESHGVVALIRSVATTTMVDTSGHDILTTN